MIERHLTQCIIDALMTGAIQPILGFWSIYEGWNTGLLIVLIAAACCLPGFDCGLPSVPHGPRGRSGELLPLHQLHCPPRKAERIR